MTPEARTFILKCFCRQMSAVEVATIVNSLHRCEHVISAAQIRRIWNDEIENNVVMRQLVDRFGERPPRGYAACEHTRLAEDLVAA